MTDKYEALREVEMTIKPELKGTVQVIEYAEKIMRLESGLKLAEARLHEVAFACATAEQERDALAARVEVLKKDIGTLSALLGLRCREVEDYAAQVAALKEDAKRYRWLRDQDENSLYFIACGDTGTWGECGHSSVYGEYADSVIDAKLEQKQ